MSTNSKKLIAAALPEEIIDKILSYDKYGSVNIIIAFGLQNIYIKKYSNLIKNPSTSDLKKFLCLWRLEALVKRYKYVMNYNQLVLPKEIWNRLSYINLRESFIIQNSHNLNLAIIKYYKKGQFSHKFHSALPDFKNINKCTNCFEHDAICKKKSYKDDKELLCALCLKNLCKRCNYVEIPLEYDDHGCCSGCAGCSQYSDYSDY